MKDKLKFILPVVLALLLALGGFFHIRHKECKDFVNAEELNTINRSYQHNLTVSSDILIIGAPNTYIVQNGNIFNSLNVPLTLTDGYETDYGTFGLTLRTANNYQVQDANIINATKIVRGTFLGLLSSSSSQYRIYNLKFNSSAFNRYSASYLPSVISSVNAIADGYFVYFNSAFSSAIDSIDIEFDYTIQDVTSEDTLHHYSESVSPFTYTQFVNYINNQNLGLSSTLYSFDATYGNNCYVVDLVPLDLNTTYSIYNYSCVINFNNSVNAESVDDVLYQFTYYGIQGVNADLRIPKEIQYIDETNWFEGIATTVDNFLSIEILPNLSFYDILILAIAIPVLIWILKAWLGG